MVFLAMNFYKPFVALIGSLENESLVLLLEQEIDVFVIGYMVILFNCK